MDLFGGANGPSRSSCGKKGSYETSAGPPNGDSKVGRGGGVGLLLRAESRFENREPEVGGVVTETERRGGTRSVKGGGVGGGKGGNGWPRSESLRISASSFVIRSPSGL